MDAGRIGTAAFIIITNHNNRRLASLRVPIPVHPDLPRVLVLEGVVLVLPRRQHFDLVLELDDIGLRRGYEREEASCGASCGELFAPQEGAYKQVSSSRRLQTKIFPVLFHLPRYNNERVEPWAGPTYTASKPRRVLPKARRVLQTRSSTEPPQCLEAAPVRKRVNPSFVGL